MGDTTATRSETKHYEHHRPAKLPIRCTLDVWDTESFQPKVITHLRYGNWLSQSEAIHQSGSREVQLRARWSWSCTLYSDEHMGQGPSGSGRWLDEGIQSISKDR